MTTASNVPPLRPSEPRAVATSPSTTESGKPCFLRRRLGARGGRGERLDEHDFSPFRGERERDRPGSSVQVEHPLWCRAGGQDGFLSRDEADARVRL